MPISQHTLEVALYAYMKEESAQCGEPFTREMLNQIKLEDPEHFNELIARMMCALETACEQALEEKLASGAFTLRLKTAGSPHVHERIIEWMQKTVQVVDDVILRKKKISKAQLIQIIAHIGKQGNNALLDANAR